MEPCPFALEGKRVAVRGQNCIGTIRYVGPVKGQPPNVKWCGIAWDDELYGRHDGMVNGKRYFKTQSSTGASFVKQHLLEFGDDLQNVICRRYLDCSEEQLPSTVLTNAHRPTYCDAYRRRVKELHSLTSIVPDEAINSISDPLGLAEALPNVTLIMISKCLLDSWDPMIKFITNLPRLKTFSIKYGRLELHFTCQTNDDTASHDASKWNVDHVKNDSVEELTLNNTGHSWAEITQLICHYFPKLTVLDVGYNRANALDTRLATSCLRRICLESNEIRDWSEVLKLGSIASLRSLSIARNPLRSLYIPARRDENAAVVFERLKELDLKGCPISSWHYFNCLNELSCLTHVQFTNDILSDGWTNVIARLAGLTRFNNSEITKHTRRDCEIDLIRLLEKQYAADEQLETAPESNELIVLEALREKHGMDPPQQQKDGNSLPPGCLSATHDIVHIDIKHSDEGFGCDLPASSTVTRVRQLIAKRFPTLDKGFRIYHITGRGREELKLGFKNLNFYGVDTGHALHVVGN